MQLSAKFSRLIGSAVRSQGLSYFAQRRVRITHVTRDDLQATVRGSENYTVELTLEADGLFASCTCPYYDANLEVCKHIWAAMLEADGRGFGASYNGPVRLKMDEDEEYEDEYYDDGYEDYRPTTRLVMPAQSRQRQESAALNWKKQLGALRQAMGAGQGPARGRLHQEREFYFIVDVTRTLQGQGVLVEIACRERKANGEWGKLKTQGFSPGPIAQLPDAADLQIFALLQGARDQYGYGGYYYHSTPTSYLLTHPLDQTLLPLMCQTGRCRLRRSAVDEEMPGLAWDDGPAWEFWLEIRRAQTSASYVILGSFRRGEERMEIAEPDLLVAGGLVFARGHAARLNDFNAFAWIGALRQHGALYVPLANRDDLLAELLQLPNLPRLDLPEEMRYEEVTGTPRPMLKVRKGQARPYYYGDQKLVGELAFDYEGTIIPREDARGSLYHAERRQVVRRDAAAEQAAAARLYQLGFRETNYYQVGNILELPPAKLPRAVRDRVAEHWRVEAEGKLYKQPGELRIEVRSGIDWFELHGEVEFGETTAKLPALLAALRRGENTVQLGDGTFGLLPEEWLNKYGLLAGLGEAQDDHLRFRNSQVGLLDALLAAQPEATFDEQFERARARLQSFAGITALDPPPGFVGELRGYQREGLGWFHFLQEFGFGGCLADQMGLGKTVMVLALLETRRVWRAQQAAEKRPKAGATRGRQAGNNGASNGIGTSLVVVPKSLVFNWQQEAARFTPGLRILDHTGQFRRKETVSHFGDYDLVITTYGTLRRDAARFKDVQFDYVILDESQAIKNASTESAKATRLLRGNHRLTLSGTPIENHLGELWSLFDFLNPGMLGTASLFKLGGAAARNPDEETRALLARALRPYILRRTKDQVAKELPARTEQTIFCELEAKQRKQYDELRNHYRQALLGRIERDGWKRAKIMVLEALLRLRQAACHPGLLDKSKGRETGAKLDVLLPHLAELAEEGKKALVFSQFTSLLAIVRHHLDAQGVAYEYLDGRTRDRAARVNHFQNDPDCQLFLISLKAGGLGLNLTAAEYVFLLDPWWNPAVEAQAIDRTHRIGQTRQVFAYRLIARNTVEEKVLELQNSKRELADAIINADNSLIRDLSREDLELLLS